jgi:hypothetical protein
MKKIGLMFAIAALGVTTSASAGTIDISPAFPGTVTGSYTFTEAGSEDFNFTIVSPYDYQFTLTAGAFSTTSSGGAGKYSVLVTASRPGTVDYSLVTTGVPEVSTWAMMLLGFAGLGWAGYRRSRQFA